MHLILTGCEYVGTTTLGWAISQWAAGAMGGHHWFHDHWKIPHINHPAQDNLALAQGKALLGGKTVVGGLDNVTGLIEAASQELAWEARGIRLAMGSEGWMLGTGCTFKPETPEAKALREEFTLEDLRKIRDNLRR